MDPVEYWRVISFIELSNIKNFSGKNLENIMTIFFTLKCIVWLPKISIMKISWIIEDISNDRRYLRRSKILWMIEDTLDD